MSAVGTLFEVEAAYCIDTNVVVSFLSETDDEFYGADIFRDQWHLIEERIETGEIVAPREVEVELKRHAKKRAKIGPWLSARRDMFRDIDTAQLELAKRLVNRYPAYGRDNNYLGDLTVISLAGARGLAVISLEQPVLHPGQKRPKIPNVCAEFGITHLSVSGFLRRILGAPPLAASARADQQPTCPP